MKHCKEGRFGSNPEITALSSLFLFLLIFPGSILAQIPINGFCRFESFKTAKGFNNVLALNFNNDSYTDLLVFGADSKIFIASKGQENSTFSSPHSNSLNCRISQIKLLDDKNSSSNLYAFAARKDRIVGVLKISQSGTATIISEKTVDSYPDNLSVADINRDGNKEILVSGGSFNGVSVFSFNNGRLEERKLFNNKVFTHLALTDLNNDSYPDIAAFDLLGSSIRFYYNNSIGDFYEVREFKINGKISLLMPYDFNLDNFKDLIYVQDRQIHFLFGDSRAIFNNSFSLTADHQIDDLALGDFNRDGLLDIAYISKDKSLLSIIFSKEQNRFYGEIQYFSKNGISKIIPFYSRYIHGVLALSSQGEYYLISEVSKIRDNLKISLGLKPALIGGFDAFNDGIPDICYYDRARPSLNLIVRNNAGLPSGFYSVPLLDSCSDMIVNDLKAKTKTFYCFSKGKKLIQIAAVDLQKKKTNVENLYSAEPIEDLKIKQEEGSSKPVIYILCRDHGSLRLFCFRYNNFRYTFSSSGKLDSNVIQARLVLSSPAAVFYWKKDKKGLAFNKIIVNSDLNFQESDAKYVLPLKNNVEIFNFAGDIFNNDSTEAVNFIFSNNSKFAVVSSGDRCFRLDLKGSIKDLKLKEAFQVSFMENPLSGLNDMFVFNSSSSSLDRFDLLNKQKTLLGKKIVETKNLGSYFVKSLSSDKYHLIYTDKAENCIKIKEIYF